MPFTISHAAAVLPLHRLSKARLPLAALMIGSMSPDFSYFLPGDVDFSTHRLPSLLWFCLPVGLAAWLLFVWMLEEPTIALLPATWRARITPSDRRVSLAAFLFASLAIVIGAASHIVWDAFTHGSSPVVSALPFLRVTVFKIGYEHYRLFKVLQHVSSLAGMLALFVWAWRIRHAPAVQSPTGPALEARRVVAGKARAAALFIVVIASCVFGIAEFLNYPDVDFERRLFHLAMGGMTGCVLAWLAVASAIHWRWRKASRSSTG
jgi:hypothetical protein